MDALTGRLPAETDTRTLQMGDYTRYFDSDDPEQPRRFGLGPDGKFVGALGAVVDFAVDDQLSSQDYQTCVPASMVRLAQAWGALDGRLTMPQLDQTLELYEKISPFRREPISGVAQEDGSSHPVTLRRREHNDYGASLLTALKIWASPEQSLRAELPAAKAFFEIEPRNLEQLREAVWRFGGVLIGLALPQSILGPHSTPRESWYVPGYGPIYDATPGSLSSHCVAITGYSPHEVFCITGGRLHSMSWQFLLSYVEECYAVLGPEVVDRFPGLAVRIQADLDAVRNADRPLGMPAFPHRWRGGNIM